MEGISYQVQGRDAKCIMQTKASQPRRLPLIEEDEEERAPAPTGELSTDRPELLDK